jgi:hypothetical protein
MKPVVVTPKNLNLNRETVRLLNTAELKLAAGGKPVASGATRCAC